VVSLTYTVVLFTLGGGAEDRMQQVLAVNTGNSIKNSSLSANSSAPVLSMACHSCVCQSVKSVLTAQSVLVFG